MADFSSQPDYGLDPSIVSYLQGGQPLADAYMHDPRGQQPAIADDPNAPGIIHGGAPQQVMSEYNVPGAVIANLPPSPPPPPPPPAAQHIGTDYGLPAPILTGIQNGFAQPEANVSIPAVTPTGGLPQAQQQADIAGVKQTAPDFIGGTVATPSDADIKKSNAAFAQKQAFENSPEGLAEKSDQEQRDAIAEAEKSNQDQLAAEQASNTAQANAMDAHQKRQAEIDAQEQAKQAQFVQNRDKIQQHLDQQVQDYANYKVDTNRDVGIGGLIAIALSGIGDALDHRHGPNMAAQMIDAQIDKRINDQWKNKEALGQNVEMTKGQLANLRANADDDRQAMALQKAGELNRAADDINRVKAQYANPAAQARAEATEADLRGKAAAIIAGEANRKAGAIAAQQAAQQKAVENAQKWAEIATTQRGQDLVFAGKKAELDAQQAKELQSQNKAEQDAVSERGLPMPKAVNPDGTVHYEYAKQEDGSIYKASPKAMETLGPIRAATYDHINTVNKLIEARKQFSTNQQFDNYITSNEEGRRLVQLAAQDLLDIHKLGGVNRLSGEAVDLAQKIQTGGLNADSMKNLLEELKTSRQLAIDSLDANERGVGGYTGKKMTFTDPDEAKAREKDPIDKAIEGATSLGGAESHAASIAFGAGAGPVQIIQSAESGRRQGQVDDLAKAYASAGPDDKKRIMQGLGNIAAHAPDDDTRKRALAVQTMLATGALDGR